MYIIYLFTFYLQKIITITQMNFRQKNQIIRNPWILCWLFLKWLDDPAKYLFQKNLTQLMAVFIINAST